MMKRNKKVSREVYLKTTITVLIVCLLTILSVLAFTKSDLNSVKSESKQITNILENPPGVKGRSCGVLSPNKANGITGEDNLKGQYTNAPTEARVKSENEEMFYWSDSCRYSSVTNSNVYVELFIETYSSVMSAKLDLQEELPVVAVSEEESEEFDELFYSAGAWFARDGEVLIKVSANDGQTSDLKEYSKKIFEELYKDIEV